MLPAVKTISFDLWDTVLIDDSDEPKRAEQGLASKAVERRNLVERFLGKHGPVDRAQIDVAYAAADAAFREVWYGHSVTWSVARRLSIVLKGLGRKLPEDEFAELVRLHEDMEVEISPDLLPGVADAIKALHGCGKYKLAIISDAIFSPGRALREIVRKYGLYEYFNCFVFSDEIGCAKPDPRVFQAVADATGCKLEEIVHLGDREQKDIEGPHAVGARGILVPIAKDRGGPNSKADAVCTDYKDLVSIIERLDA